MLPVGDARASIAGEIELGKLRWRNWGKRRATARGIFYGNMDAQERITITVYRRRNCGSPALRHYSRYVIRERSSGKKMFARGAVEACPAGA